MGMGIIVVVGEMDRAAIAIRFRCTVCSRVFLFPYLVSCVPFFFHLSKYCVFINVVIGTLGRYSWFCAGYRTSTFSTPCFT